ncbi:hypothetical protein ABMA28_003315 [Loxostege sticticalis]|uniref:PiggyBac transposable element-derived protein domain-containing protein n=1 Tax=Loxostege sticticalis TaxID=481309 RepID=A0ABD0SY49_LOXSC
MGNVKTNRYSDYWRKSYLYNLFARHFMSRNRFLLILRCLRFGVNNLESLIDYFNKKIGIRQYLKGKRHKYGIKLYILATPGGLTLQLHMYKGKRDNEVGGQGHTNKVVAKLLKHYLNTGRHVYMDNFYNSVDLADFLLRNKTHVTGTLRVKRKRNPSIVCTSKLRRGGSIFRFNRAGSCVCKWKDQRDVLMISTKHSPELKVFINKRGQQILKPDMVIEYNKFMNAVDRHDQMMSYYTCEHKTMRWYKKVGIHIFQTMLLNAYFLFNMKMGKTMDYLEFREVVITKLLPPPPEGHRVDRQANHSICHLPAHLPKDQKDNTKRRRCKYCWDTKKVRKNCLFYCPECENEPGLCLECFRTYHRYN